MDIRVLNYFLMVAREENVTKASQLLHITQPTLSRQLKQLEEELGVKLFKRSDHSIYLTEEGMLFRRRAQEMVNLADKAKSELAEWSGDFAKEMDFSATYNALYNAVIVAREKKGAVICLLLESHYDDMVFIPFEPRLELSTVLAWKEQVMQSRVTSAFREYIKKKYK